PVIWFARLTLVREPDDPRAQLVVIGLDTARTDASISPTVVDRLSRPRRDDRNRRRVTAAAQTKAAAESAEFDYDWHRCCGAGWHREAGLNIHSDLRILAVIDMPGKRFRDRRNFAALGFGCIRHFPGHLGNIGGNPAINFSFEIFQDFRAALR